jgi:hypothetical protein
VPERAIVAELRRCAGTQFGPGVVAGFLTTPQEAGSAFAERDEVAS